MSASTNEVRIVRSAAADNFTILRNDIARDARLSWKATGIITYLLGLPHDWRLRLSHLSQQKLDGRDSTRAGLAELETTGYLRIEVVRDESGRFLETVWHVTDTPATSGRAGAENPQGPAGNMRGSRRSRAGSPNSAYPNTANPNSANPNSAKPTLQSTKGQKTEVTKKEAAEARAREAASDGEAAGAAAEPARKKRNKRPSGIVTWDAGDIEAAERIEQQQPQGAITAAVHEVPRIARERGRRNPNPDPTPGLVQEALDVLAARAAKIAAATAERQVDDVAQTPEGIQRGRAMVQAKIAELRGG